MTVWQRRCLWIALLLSFASGVAWLLAQHVFTVDDGFGPMSHPLGAWALRLHGVAAYALLVVVGSLWPLHMRLGWRSGRNRRSGLWMGGSMLTLALSGLGLYYGPQAGREWVALAHWLLGSGLPVLVFVHWYSRSGSEGPD